MVRHVMTLILDVGRNIKWMVTIDLYMIPLKKILYINYTYGYLKQPVSKKILWKVTILFIYQRMGERGGLLRPKERLQEGKNILQSK